MSVHHGRNTSCSLMSAKNSIHQEPVDAYLAQPGILSLKKLPLELGLVDAIAVFELSRFEWPENMLRRAELREPGTGASPVLTSSLSFTIRIVDVIAFR